MHLGIFPADSAESRDWRRSPFQPWTRHLSRRRRWVPPAVAPAAQTD
jgi:hypothetical protein